MPEQFNPGPPPETQFHGTPEDAVAAFHEELAAQPTGEHPLPVEMQTSPNAGEQRQELPEPKTTYPHTPADTIATGNQAALEQDGRWDKYIPPEMKL
jgi:hypothetical protein